MEFHFDDGYVQAYDFEDVVNELVFITQEDVLNQIQCYEALEPLEAMSVNVFDQTILDQANGHENTTGYCMNSPVSTVPSSLSGESRLSYGDGRWKDSTCFADSISLPVHSFDDPSATSAENMQAAGDIQQPWPESSSTENSSPTPERDIGDFAIYGIPKLISRNAKPELEVSRAYHWGAKESQVVKGRRQQPRRRVRSLLSCSAYNMKEHLGVKVPEKPKTSRARRNSGLARRRIR